MERVPRVPAHPFVGRSVQRRRLSELWDTVLAGSPVVGLVSGDAGAGKTRLLEETAARVAGAGGIVVLGSCVEVAGMGLPYLPIVDALRSIESTPHGRDLLQREAERWPALARLVPHLAFAGTSHQANGVSPAPNRAEPAARQATSDGSAGPDAWSSDRRPAAPGPSDGPEPAGSAGAAAGSSRAALDMDSGIASATGSAIGWDREAALDRAGGLTVRAGRGDPSATDPLMEMGQFGDALMQGQLFQALHRLLTELSRIAPVLVEIEDVHWADRSTRDLLSFLARTLRDARVMLLASYRSDDLHRRHPLRPLLAELTRLPHVERLQLEPFSQGELAEFLDGLAGRPVDPLLIEQVYRRSEGNAFFAEELFLTAPQRRGVLGLPDDLVDVLLAKVAALPEEGRAVLKVAAVAGRRARHDLMVVAASPDRPVRAVRIR